MTQTDTAQSDRTVQVTLRLPREIYQQASQTADGERCSVEDFLSQLVVGSLQMSESRRLWQSISDRYRRRLANEGKLDQSPDEILRELSELREEVANERYPE